MAPSTWSIEYSFPSHEWLCAAVERLRPRHATLLRRSSPSLIPVLSTRCVVAENTLEDAEIRGESLPSTEQDIPLSQAAEEARRIEQQTATKSLCLGALFGDKQG
jgi:hypothetical protein